MDKNKIYTYVKCVVTIVDECLVRLSFTLLACFFFFFAQEPTSNQQKHGAYSPNIEELIYWFVRHMTCWSMLVVTSV